MNLLVLSTFAIICVIAVESRYPYDDTYSTGDIVPSGLDVRQGYDRGRVGRVGGRYQPGKNQPINQPGKYQPGGGYAAGGYTGTINSRGNRYGNRNRDVLNRDYRRRHRDYETYLPPRGIGGTYKKHHDRPGYDYGRSRRPIINGPPRYYDDDEINYGGYKRITRTGIGYP